MQQARSEGAAIVHFPESAMSGCSKAQIKSWDRVDWDALADELHSVADLARELGLWVVVGSCHRLTPPHRPHNSLYVISDRGEVATRYDKQFCSHTEITDWYTPGRECCVFEVEGWRFGCALCIEIHFPELFQEYADSGRRLHPVLGLRRRRDVRHPGPGLRRVAQLLGQRVGADADVPRALQPADRPDGREPGRGDAIGVRDCRRSARRALPAMGDRAPSRQALASQGARRGDLSRALCPGPAKRREIAILK